MKPVVDFFIVGAPKAGTTTLHDLLSLHPDIFMPALKEPNYFTSAEISGQKLYYNEKIIANLKEYEALFEKGKNKLKGEASVSYLFYPGTAKRIFQYNPSAKIIILLRYPVERAISHYLMDARLGFVKQNPETIFHHPDHEACSIFFQQYFLLGCYYQQVKNYLDVFPREQIGIFFFDDLKADQQTFIKRVFEFLNVDPGKVSVALHTSNPAMAFRSGFLQRLYQIKFFRKLFKFMIPDTLFRSVSGIMMKPQQYHFSESFRKQLEEFYSHDIGRLENLLEISLERWKR